jgi:NitT/TauT family transport system ATP-binding protein
MISCAGRGNPARRLSWTLRIENIMPVENSIITAQDISISYTNSETGKVHLAVKGISLEVKTNEFLVVVGPSGCGKSTVLSAIAGFMKPTSGTLLMHGCPIDGPGSDRGVVFQDYALLPWKTVLDNVALGLKFGGVAKAERHKIARKYLAMAGLADAEAKFPHELSGGMRQRAAVARTLANRPEVMLMDEPFAAVDAQTRMTLQEELVRIWQESNVTIFFVTHSVEEAIFLGDRVVVLSSGPGVVKASIDINIDRAERNWSVLNHNPRFHELRDQITELVRKSE